MSGENQQHGQLFQDKWVQHLRAKSGAAKIHCQYCSVAQGFPNDVELGAHMRCHHSTLLAKNEKTRAGHRSVLPSPSDWKGLTFCRSEGRRSSQEKKQVGNMPHDAVKASSLAQRPLSSKVVEGLQTMRIDNVVSHPPDEHSDKRMAMGMGPIPSSSITTKSEESIQQPLQKPQQQRALSSPTPPDFGPRAAAGNKRLFDYSEGPSGPNTQGQMLSSRPTQQHRLHRAQTLPQNAMTNIPVAPQRGVLPAPRPVQGRRDSSHMVRQPDTKPISQDQLVAEVKGIYAGLVMVEGKCIQVDLKQAQLAREVPPGQQPPALSNEQYQALIALHRTLLHEHHDFFLASQHPSASSAVKRLAVKYAMPARLWRHGIHSFLELLRNRLPLSLDYMLAFIYLAYSMMTLLLETVPTFKDTWIECLGDLGRYRMAIEDDNQRDREVWTQVARQWYLKSANRSPTTGRLYHHLAILARPDALPQLLYYGKSLSVPTPFMAARESIMTLFEPALHPKGRQSRFSAMTAAFVRCHAIIFTGDEIDTFDKTMEEFTSGLDAHIGRITKKYLEQGYFLAISNCMAVLSYGAEKNPINVLIKERDAPKQDLIIAAEPLPEGTAKPPPADNKIGTPQSLVQSGAPGSAITFEQALRLFNLTAKIHLQRIGDTNVLSFIHVTLVFLRYMSQLDEAMDILATDFPWTNLSNMLNSVLRFQEPTNYAIIESEAMPKPEEPYREKNLGLCIPEKPDIAGDHDESIPPAADEFRPFPEEWAMRGLKWTEGYFPDMWFVNENVEVEKHYMEAESMRAEHRPERVLWLGVQLTKTTDRIAYDPSTHRFSA